MTMIIKKAISLIKDYYSNMSIVFKSLLSYLLILFIPVTVSGILIYNNYIGNLVNQKDNLLIKIVTQYKDSIDTKFESIETLANEIITNKLIKQFFYYTGDDIFKKADDENNILVPYLYFLTNLNKKAYKNVYQIKFYTYDSNVPVGAFIDKADGIMDKDWYRDIKKIRMNEGKWEGLHKCRSDLSAKNAPVFTYYRNLFSQSYYSLFATLQIDISKDDLINNLKNVNIDKSGFLFVADKKDILVSGRYADDTAYNIEKYIMSGPASKKGMFIYKYQGNEYVVYSEPINRLDLLLVAVVPSKEYNGNIDAQRNIFIGIIIASMVVLMILAYLLTILNSNKVRKVLSGIRKISDGDLKVRVNIKGMDEMGEIAGDLNHMAERLDEMVNVVYKAKIAEKEAMLLALQSQINPHFLYNILESIKMMAEIKEEYEISDALDTLGKFMRYNISRTKEIVTVKEEIENVNNYFSIQKIRFKNLIELSVKVPEGLYGCKVLKMILQPLVENAIAYGSSGRQRIVNIEIGISGKKGHLIITVRNSGTIIPDERLELLQRYIDGLEVQETIKTSGNGIGLKNINERIKLCFGDKYGLIINNFEDNGNTGVEVVILLPVVNGEGWSK